MRDILKFKGKIKPIMSLSLEFMKANPELFMMQDTIFSLQMAAYWIQEAAELQAINASQSSDVELAGEPMYADEDVKITESKEQLRWIYSSLSDLSTQMYKFVDEVPLSQIAKLWLINAVTRVTEARFAVQITSIQYEGLQNIGGPSLLSH